jgi:hypothetical protein
MTRRSNVEATIAYVGLAVTVFGMFWWMDHYCGSGSQQFNHGVA